MKNKTENIVRLFLVALLLIFMTFFVIVYIEAQNLENPMTSTPKINEISGLKEDDISDDCCISETQQTIDAPIVETPNVPIQPQHPSYTEYEVELLARLINAEANIYLDTDGIWKYCSDDWQCYVACVALNRVESSDPGFPDTLEEVIFQEGQYACIWDGNFEQTPTERAYENARRVLEGYRPVPKEVLFQSAFLLGTVWQKVGNTYFCYG